jgi:hypothetical protein
VPSPKLEYVNRLSDTWRDLADALVIPVYEQRKFLAGDEARGIWDWLEYRDRLHLLAPALRDVNRDDLADLFDNASRAANDHVAEPDPAILTVAMLTTDWRWESVYIEVLKGAGAGVITVIDQTDSHRTQVEILFVVYQADEILDGSVDESRLLARLERERDNDKLTVFVFVVGDRCAEARQLVRRWLRATDLKWFVDPVLDPDKLRDEISTRIQSGIEKNPYRRAPLDDPSRGDI